MKKKTIDFLISIFVSVTFWIVLMLCALPNAKKGTLDTNAGVVYSQNV